MLDFNGQIYSKLSCKLQYLQDSTQNPSMASLSFCWWGGASLISFFPFAGVQYSSASIQRQKTYNIRPGIFAPWRPKVRPEIHPFTPWRPFSSHFKFRVRRDSKGNMKASQFLLSLEFIFVLHGWSEVLGFFVSALNRVQVIPLCTGSLWSAVGMSFPKDRSVGHATEAGVTRNTGPRDHNRVNHQLKM